MGDNRPAAALRRGERPAPGAQGLGAVPLPRAVERKAESQTRSEPSPGREAGAQSLRMPPPSILPFEKQMRKHVGLES